MEQILELIKNLWLIVEGAIKWFVHFVLNINDIIDSPTIVIFVIVIVIIAIVPKKLLR